MRSSRAGRRTLRDVEVLNVSPFGVWLWVKGSEHFLDAESFPWFQHATIQQIGNVRLEHETALHWPDLDVDLHVESLAHPERFPLVFRDRDREAAPDGRRRTKRRPLR